MIYSMWLRRYAPFEKFGFGFEGDKRTAASTSMAVTARTAGGCSFGPGHVGGGTADSSGTSFTGLGSTVAGGLGKHYSKVSSSVAVKTRSISAVRFTVHTAGSNPMVPGAPDIDTFVDVYAAFRTGDITIEGTVRGDEFPNAEVFVYDGMGNARLLFAYATSGGQNLGPMTGLAGAHENVKLGSFFVALPILRSGAFSGGVSH